MKRVVATVAVALLAVGVYAAVAPAGPQAVTPRQFAALSKKVTKLQKDLRTLNGIVTNCLTVGALPIAEYGDPSQNEGYIYGRADESLELTTALDVSPAASAQAWLLTTTPQCVEGLNKIALKRLRPHVK